MNAAKVNDQPLQDVIIKRMSQNRDERRRIGEISLQKPCMERDLNWNQLTENKREEFVNRLLHEK